MAKFTLHNNQFSYDSVSNSITLLGVSLNSITELTQVVATENNIVDILYRADIGRTGILTTDVNNNQVILLDYQNPNISNNATLEILVDTNNIQPIPQVQDDEIYFFEYSTPTVLKYKGLQKICDSNQFETQSNVLYKIEVRACISNEKKEEGGELYCYLDDDLNQLLIKLKQVSIESNEEHSISEFIVKQITSGVHFISIYGETTKNKKEATFKDIQILIKPL